MAVRRCKKEDLRRIAKATGATLVSSLANLEGDETFEKESLGYAEEVVQERISDDELILVKGTKVVSSASIILRGANGKRVVFFQRFASTLFLPSSSFKTTCLTKWSVLCMILFLSSRELWRVELLFQEEELSRLPCRSTWRSLLPHWFVSSDSSISNPKNLPNCQYL